MAAARPLTDEAALAAASDEAWRNLAPADWSQAFRGHPRIGESRPSLPASPSRPAFDRAGQSVEWSAEEQQNVEDAGAALKAALAEANREYERRFGRTFIVCASGKSAAEILEILRRRLQNDAPTELQLAAEEQRQITQIRLRKWLQA
jgi:2-oxo-4-hydroxy-4-carboxy-5-ureidoimidazoline decarboxylase